MLGSINPETMQKFTETVHTFLGFLALWNCKLFQRINFKDSVRILHISWRVHDQISLCLSNLYYISCNRCLMIFGHFTYTFATRWRQSPCAIFNQSERL